jgi:hypothetical protein
MAVYVAARRTPSNRTEPIDISPLLRTAQTGAAARIELCAARLIGMRSDAEGTMKPA